MTTRLRDHLTRRAEYLALLAILLLAAYLRLNHLGWTEYKLDEANLSRLSLNLARGIEFPLLGLGSSTGIVNLPLAPWLMAIPYAVSPDPIAATGFVAALNVVAVAGCYGLARGFFRSATGQAAGGAATERPATAPSYLIPASLATLLFAVAPWAVIHSRKIWAQDLLPPFVLLWAWSGWLAFVKGRARALIVHALALAACIHLHYSGLWLIPVSLIWAIVFARRLRPRPALAALAVFLATFAPFVFADLLRGAPNLTRLVEIIRQPALFDVQALRLSWLMIAGQEIHSLAGPQEFQNFLASAPGGETGFALTGAIGALVVAAALLALLDVLRAARRRALDDRSAAAFVLVTWLAAPIIVQTRHVLPVFTHYFIILYPAPFLLVGWLAGQLAERAKTAGAALIAGLLIVAGLQSLQSIALQQFVAGRATPGGYGVPVEMSLRVADEAAAASRASNGAEALVYAEGDDPLVHEGASVLDVLLPPDVPRRFVDLAQATMVFPSEAAVIIWYSPNGMLLPDALAGRTALRRPEAGIPLRAGEAPAQVRDWPGQAAATPPCTAAAPLGRWQNGVALLEARPSGEWRGPGGWIELCYRVEAEASQAGIHWFTHLIGPEGRRWAQADGPGYPSGSWRAGDVVVIRFGPYTLPADASPGRYTLRVGMYAYPEIANVPLIDAAGNPAGDAAEIDLGDLSP